MNPFTWPGAFMSCHQLSWIVMKCYESSQVFMNRDEFNELSPFVMFCHEIKCHETAMQLP